MPDYRDFEKEIAGLRDKMNRLFSDLPREMGRPEAMEGAEWIPAVDILENKDDIIVKVDIPGMKADEINLYISGDVLQISGDREREVQRADENYHNIERGYGKFSRKVTLPALPVADSIKASYKDGVLTIKSVKPG